MIYIHAFNTTVHVFLNSSYFACCTSVLQNINTIILTIRVQKCLWIKCVPCDMRKIEVFSWKEKLSTKPNVFQFPPDGVHDPDGSLSEDSAITIESFAAASFREHRDTCVHTHSRQWKLENTLLRRPRSNSTIIKFPQLFPIHTLFHDTRTYLLALKHFESSPLV